MRRRTSSLRAHPSTSSTLRPGLLATAVALGAMFAPADVFAQQADTSVDTASEAKRQFLLGRQAFDAKRYADAAQNFEAAAAYKPHPVTFFTAALAWELAGRSDRAADAFSRAVEQPGLKDEDARKARERLSALEGVLGTVTVNAPDGWKVQLDGNTETQAPARLHAKPGLRTLIYRAPGKAVDKKEVTLEAGQKVAISLPEPTPQVVAEPEPIKEPVAKAPAPVAAAEDPMVTIRKSAGLVLAGIGAAGLGAALVVWSQAQDAKDVYDEKPTRAGLDHGENMQTWTNVLLIGGTVFLAGGITLYVLPVKKTNVSVGVTPGGGMLRGQF